MEDGYFDVVFVINRTTILVSFTHTQTERVNLWRENGSNNSIQQASVWRYDTW